MFRKRTKKDFPPGTFIAKPARICAIIQLCLAFSLLLWNASEPFVGEIFSLKSHLLFYQDVMGIPMHDKMPTEKLERLSRNAERFEALPRKTKQTLTDEMKEIQQELQRSFWDKLKSMISLYVYQLSPYELAWIFFSIVISIMLLKQVEGATQVVWLLPLITACYAVDSLWFKQPQQQAAEIHLFPSEKELVDLYLKEPLSDNVFDQQEQLQRGWKRYLIIHWANQEPSDDLTQLERQAEDGEFTFTLARIEARANTPRLAHRSPPPSIPLLLLYFFWNTYFAYTASTCCKVKYERGLK